MGVGVDAGGRGVAGCLTGPINAGRFGVLTWTSPKLCGACVSVGIIVVSSDIERPDMHRTVRAAGAAVRRRAALSMFVDC